VSECVIINLIDLIIDGVVGKERKRGSVEEPVYANQSQIIAEIRRHQAERQAIDERQRLEQVAVFVPLLHLGELFHGNQ